MSKFDRQMRRNAQRNAAIQATSNELQSKRDEAREKKAKEERANDPKKLKMHMWIWFALLAVCCVLFFAGGEKLEWYFKIALLIGASGSLSMAMKNFFGLKLLWDKEQEKQQ